MPGDRFHERVALAMQQTQQQMATIIAVGKDKSVIVLISVYGIIVVVFAIALMPDQPNVFAYLRDLIDFLILCYAEIGLVLLSAVLLSAICMFLSYFFHAPTD